MPRALSTLAAATALALLSAACGSDEDGGAPPAKPRPTAAPADFPDAAGKTIQSLRAETGQSLVFAPSVQELRKGTNRYGFALFDTARKQVTGAAVALYTARADGSGLRGPYIARSESLKVRGPFQSRTTASDPDAAKAVYVADVPFKRNGKQIVTAMAKLDGRLISTNAFSVDVGAAENSGPPEVGEKAIRVHTKTIADVGGDASQISTRNPPAEDLLRTDLADVLGKKPVVITFATPLLCASRVCGPVVDIVEEAKAQAPSSVAFIHQEIYRDNQVDKGVQAPVASWRLRSEPWTFVIDRRGKIAARFEGAFSVGELRRAIDQVS